MINEKGNILITVIFMMVILLIVAIGITSVGSGGLENSVLSSEGIGAAQNVESIEKIIRGGTNWATGEDLWVQTASILPNILERNRLEIKIYVDNQSKNVDFSLPNLTSASAVYISAVKNNLAGFGVTLSSAPAGAVISGDISKDPSKNYSRMIAPFRAGSYRLGINSPDNEEYVVFVRIFCKE